MALLAGGGWQLASTSLSESWHDRVCWVLLAPFASRAQPAPTAGLYSVAGGFPTERDAARRDRAYSSDQLTLQPLPWMRASVPETVTVHGGFPFGGAHCSTSSGTLVPLTLKR